MIKYGGDPIVLSEDIVLDEEAFDRAISEFDELLTLWQNLRNSTEDMLADLREGFQTPAGNKFISACETNLFAPLDDQKAVIEHVSRTLQESKQAYSSVFAEYETLVNLINQSKN